jgi:hypothetical protein
MWTISAAFALTEPRDVNTLKVKAFFLAGRCKVKTSQCLSKPFKVNAPEYLNNKSYCAVNTLYLGCNKIANERIT